ncbi:hypothetical protein K435DRAFT_822159 [Dendrothele bispora CBS 962.96]|uniref:ER transporter 6TM N-terminal domain-containing protein n=1 Tax=Dendrothele bispora (strain CBS 962.96) TaxID=1314807 RepID=A0A4S8LDG2_DENBC|nr:hypothetical protein K435DRAFT_822159 [Dendrothele bispora CBS 962.96]
MTPITDGTVKGFRNLFFPSPEPTKEDKDVHTPTEKESEKGKEGPNQATTNPNEESSSSSSTASSSPKDAANEPSSNPAETLKTLKTKPKPKTSSSPSSSSWTSHIPPWILTNLKSPRSRKTWLRCWLAAWVGFVILLPHRTLNTLGASAFFTMLSAFFLPPNMPVQMFFFMISTMLIGVLMGWAIGAAGMRAASAVRSQALLQAATQQLQQRIQSNPALQANPAFAQQDAVFHGLFLDTGSSVMFGLFLGIGTFFFGLIRAYAPKLTILSIFGTIAVDIYCSYGPLFPTPQYTLLRSLLIAASTYCAIGLVLTIFVFPQSMSHSVLGTIAEQVGRARELVEVQEEVLRKASAEGGRVTNISGFISLEFSWGKWSSDDVKDLLDPVGSLIARISGLQCFGRLVAQTYKIREHYHEQNQDQDQDHHHHHHHHQPTDPKEKSKAPKPSQPKSKSRLKPKLTNDTYLMTQINQVNTSLESTYSLRLTDLVPVLSKSSLPLRQGCIRGLDVVKRNLENVNKHRWAVVLDPWGGARGKCKERDRGLEGELDEAIEGLRGILEVFREKERLLILEPFTPLLQRSSSSTFGSPDSWTEEELHSLPLRNLYLSYVFCTNLVGVAEALIPLMELVRSTVGKRRYERMWAPKGMRAVWKMVSVKGGEEGEGDTSRVLGDEYRREVKVQGVNGSGSGGKGKKGEKGEKGEKESEEAGWSWDEGYRLDPDSRPPTNVFQKIMNTMHALYHWTKSSEARFTFKYVFMTLALWAPAVVNKTANFYYVQRGFWALIMAQTTLNIYAADQIYNLITRFLGTTLGLVIGLVAWYMGNAHGTGNPYGAAAATGAIMVPVVFIRVFAPPQYMPGVILTCVTAALIVGYSWVDGNLVQYSSPGIGWDVAWKRFTLVVIGSAASFIMMMLPPTSGRKAVRLRNAAVISQLADIYSFLLSTWISTNSTSAKDDPSTSSSCSRSDEEELTPVSNHPNTKWRAEFRRRLLNAADALSATRSLTGIARWEGSIRGKWPIEEYMRLLDVESEMISSLAQLGGALAHMDDEWRVQFLHSTKALNPHFITDVMAVFSLISQSLRTAEPLHTVLPQSLIGRLMYHSHSHHHMHMHHPQPDRSEGGSTLAESKRSSMSLDHIASIDYMYYATGVVAIFQLLESLDELHRITKRLCGEVPLKGFVDWRDQFEREHTITRN